MIHTQSAKYAICFCYLFYICACLRAQDSLAKGSHFTWNGFVDAYYSYDIARPDNHEKPPFLYNHNRHNEVTINLVLAGLSYNDSTKRASLGLMAGTYAQYNLAPEPELFRHLFEASVGVRLMKSREIWIDAGILPSHIGFESAVSKDCWTLTRSILAENSPYYEAGVRASYKSSNQQWYIAGLLLNGWQRIKRSDGNNTPSFGTQLTYTPTKKFAINSSTFVGNDKPDSARKLRYFHNLYSTWELSSYWAVTLGFDIGFEQAQKNSARLHRWFAPIFILRYQFDNWALAVRAEYYDDKKGVIVPLVNQNPFRMQGYSLNIDRAIFKKVLWRAEGRFMENSTKYFTNRSSLSKRNFFLTSSLSFFVH